MFVRGIKLKIYSSIAFRGSTRCPKVQGRMWKLMLKGPKEVMIKLVAQAVPTYFHVMLQAFMESLSPRKFTTMYCLVGQQNRTPKTGLGVMEGHVQTKSSGMFGSSRH